jgi:hypothetical protein
MPYGGILSQNTTKHYKTEIKEKSTSIIKGIINFNNLENLNSDL